MADNRKYYYFRLTENFFDTDKMVILEGMRDGYLYSNILLKLYAKSLKGNGRLMLNECIPYDSNMLSQITRHSVGTVEKALQAFNKLGLIEILDTGAIYMIDIQNFIGKSSTEADRKREFRSQIEYEKRRINTGKLPLIDSEDDGQMSEKSTTNVHESIEIENKDKRIEKESTICSEPEEPAPSPSGIKLTLVDKSYYDVPVEKIELWKESYPAVDVSQELRKMAAWLYANPTRRKTRRGIERFINNWLARTQDHAGGRGNFNGSRSQEPVPANYEISDEYKELYKILDNLPSSPDDPFQ